MNYFRSAFALLTPVLLCLETLMAGTVLNQHYLHLNIEPNDNILTGRDKMLVQTTDRYWEFSLNADIELLEVRLNDKLRDAVLAPGLDNNPEVKTYRVARKIWEKSEALLDVSYRGVFYQMPDESSFSREKIAQEITGTISEDGVFLAPDAHFYPVCENSLTLFKTIIQLPAGWDAVSEGHREVLQKNNDRTEIRYETEYPLDGIFVTAAQWVVDHETVNGTDFYTFFFPEDSTLAKDYLRMSIDYVSMYEEMLSPYPFSKFAVVENFFPTGYGMPSYTVLGKSVVNLPFIVYTSLGHEVLHNWWGNSVFIGDDGNWCEGLTSYQADYFYKLQQSEETARQYRRDLLKDYTIYVNDSNEFPLSEFSGRYDMASRSIGYGKAAMIFHMLEEMLGSEMFMQSLQEVINRYSFQKTDWADFFQVMEEVSGVKLSDFKTAWIDENGAPQLRLVKRGDEFFIEQHEVVKPLQAEVVYAYSDGSRMTQTIEIKTASGKLVLPERHGLTEISVDPDYHVMRRLDETEMDVTLRHILNEDRFVFVVPEFSEEWESLARTFNSHISENNELEMFLPNDPVPELPVIFLGVMPPDVTDVAVNGELSVYDSHFSAQDHSVVWAYKRASGVPALVVYSGSSGELIPIARKIPHYGKYGYLIFHQGNNVSKGNHQSDETPLIWQIGESE